MQVNTKTMVLLRTQIWRTPGCTLRVLMSFNVRLSIWSSPERSSFEILMHRSVNGNARIATKGFRYFRVVP